MSERANGSIKWSNRAKGYGFIAPLSGSVMFFDRKSIEESGHGSRNEGQAVSFEAVKGPKGLQAEKCGLNSNETFWSLVRDNRLMELYSWYR